MATDRRSIARAALDSIAFQVADALALMHEVGGVAVWPFAGADVGGAGDPSGS